MAKPPLQDTVRERRRRAAAALLAEIAIVPAERRRPLEDELIALHLGVAREVARRYRGRGLPLEDLEQVASLGLVKAVRAYDPAKATDFLGFAVPTIRGELRRHFRDHGWTIRPPRPVQEAQGSVTRARAELWQRLGRDPRPYEIASHLGVDEALVDEASRVDGCFTPASLDAAPEDGSAVADRLGGPEPGYALVEARVALRPLMRRLSPRERKILELRFCDDRTQAEIGREVGVTQMQVSRVLSALFARLRGELAGEAA
ncbi:sigma-70 family RNA polymerase sigma factor [Nocardioides euryhalodurans]|uniref:sigma-70 family RNA polymerase sigma factor n=1 Tax=Nocardioides euryhalodurans TaxID=2518370 RepID=UPI001FC9C9D5|nr:sigma-70 family RNA polymerase sigma factor [Nocardioides euryhalodurans]